MINVSNKDVVWNYLGYGITIGIGIFLLPFVLRYLGSVELGLWYIFSSIGALVTLFDLGFAPQIARNITYAFSGASSLSKTGISNETTYSKPNARLLKTVLASSKLLYFFLATITFLMLITFGTFYIKYISKDNISDRIYTSWFLYSIGCFVNLNYSYYNSLFRGAGKFVPLNKSIVASRLSQFVISLILLRLNLGLLAVSIGYLVNTVVFRFFLSMSIKTVFNVISIVDYNATIILLDEKISMLCLLWHNAWREGLITISNYLVNQSNTLLCSVYFGLENTASYALTVQIVTLISSASTIIFGTFQPILSEANITGEKYVKTRYFSISLSFFIITFLVLVFLFLVIGFPLLEIIKSKTHIQIGVFLLYSFYVFIITNSNLSASYISTSNKLPYVFPFFISAVLSVLLAVAFAEFTNFNIWGLILAHLLVQLAYNSWKWPKYVNSELHLTPKVVLNELFFFIKSR